MENKEEKKLYIGQMVKITKKIHEDKKPKERVGIIEYIYSDYFVVRHGKYNESYRYADLITSITNAGKNTIREEMFYAKFNKNYERATKEMIPEIKNKVVK